MAGISVRAKKTPWQQRLDSHCHFRHNYHPLNLVVSSIDSQPFQDGIVIDKRETINGLL